MYSSERNKVCFLIGGFPTINRAIEIYRACGVKFNVVVVGDSAHDVLETVGKKFPDVLFAYQARQLGTGNAARCGANLLRQFNYSNGIMVVAGDKVVQPGMIQNLTEQFRRNQVDCLVAVGPRENYPNAGRVITDEQGNVGRIIEMRDIHSKKIFTALRAKALAKQEIDSNWAREYIGKLIPSERKAALALGEVWRLINKSDHVAAERILELIPEEKTRFLINFSRDSKKTISPEEAEQAEYSNLSLYLFTAEALYHVLDRLTTDNAQQEEYLTDTVAVLAEGARPDGGAFRIELLPIHDPHELMAFNNPEELLEIQNYLRSRAIITEVPKPQGLKPVTEWLAIFRQLQETIPSSHSLPLYRMLAEQYTDDEQVIKERIGFIMNALSKFHQLHGPDTETIVVRAPGLINIMGKHIDRVGGISNLMAIDREVIMVIHPRQDDLVNLANVDESQFKSRSFSISEMVAELDWDDWLMNVKSKRIQAILSRRENDWTNYIQAAVLRLQQKFRDTKISGMDIVIHGNIPIGAGLSSSSAVVMAAAEGINHLNHLAMEPQQYVNLCSEGEWFFDARRHDIDHTALKFSQKGAIARIKHLDFRVEGFHEFPPDWALVICDSHFKETDITGWRDIRNQRMAAYAIGKSLVKHLFPQYAPLIENLIDINIEKLRVPLRTIYEILLKLPEKIDRAQLARTLPSKEMVELEPLLKNHSEPAEGYFIRGMVLFALAEHARAHRCAECVKAADISGFGILMNASHDGDRIASFNERGQKQPFIQQTGEPYIQQLIKDLDSGRPQRIKRAQLWRQSGQYRCSTEQIDQMVDIACRTKGVFGAQISGAGLGGCIMALTTRLYVDHLRHNLEQHYYRPRKLIPAIFLTTPVGGSSVIAL